MKSIQLTVKLSEELAVKAVSIDYNDTHLENNSELIKKVAITIIRSLALNKGDVQLQDLLNELGIKRSK